MSPSFRRDGALRLAVWAVISSEAALFATLIVARGPAPLAPSVETVSLALAVSVALFAGGGALAASLRRTREGRPAVAERLLAGACVLGVVALSFELAAARLLAPPDPLSTVIVGLHAAHVAAGVALTGWVFAVLRSGGMPRDARMLHRQGEVLALVGTYWYFVAAVWVFIWPLFASPRP